MGYSYSVDRISPFTIEKKNANELIEVRGFGEAI